MSGGYCVVKKKHLLLLVWVNTVHFQYTGQVNEYIWVNCFIGGGGGGGLHVSIVWCISLVAMFVR